MLTASQIRRRYLDFFVLKHGHAEILGSSLIPENDPTVLFITAGMHPLVPYLLGEKHPAGTRLTDVQKCVRTSDIDEVGDCTHCTFLEMLGNWSLGDYFKKGAIEMSYEFLTSSLEDGGLGIDVKNLAVTCFAGDENAPRDEEAAGIWRGLGIPDERIAFLPREDNWWGPAGLTGPCGPDSEMFYWTGDGAAPKVFDPKDKKWVEIWNNVFLQYNKNEEGLYTPLAQKNVDTGMGLERITLVLQGKKNPYDTELFADVMHRIGNLSMDDNNLTSERIVADHIRTATFILGDEHGITPSNLDQGYVLRKLIRRAVRHGRKLGIKGHFTAELARIFIGNYGETYKELIKNESRILSGLEKEEEQFQKTLENGLKELKKIFNKFIGGVDPENNVARIDGEIVFYLYETFGLPPELSQEIMTEWGLRFDSQTMKECDDAFKAHQALSRKGAEQKFAGGLADHSLETRRLHTATHLMLEALRRVLGKTVEQKGSNITQERLRFDFNYPDKLTPEQIVEVEKIVNEAIKADYPVHFEEMSVEEARKLNATGVFADKYENELAGRVKVYFIGDYSKEICGGPHVERTGELGKSFKIVKEESSSAGIRRIKAILA